MRRPPPLSEFVHYPVTGGLALLAIVVTVASMTDHSVAALTMNYLAFHGQPWRLITSIFPHGGIVHILFNLLWLWSLGSLIEERYGHVRLAAFCIFLAVGSSAAQYAFGSGGIGLSGVVYGLWGFLWILGRYDPDWRGVIDPQTNSLMIGWFFFCIAMTMGGVWHIANFAHGFGAAFGVLVAFAVVRPRWRQRVAAGAMLLLLAATLWAATAGRTLVNYSKDGGESLAELGDAAFERNDYPAALHYYQLATAMHRTDPRWWHNLGVAYGNLGDETRAQQAFARERQMNVGHKPK